ncbi:MAG: histidine phosphatase family protein [Bacilli bacterium]
MKTTICLVRHGQTDWNAAGIIQGREDIPLNGFGKQQANDSAVYLENEQWDVLFASPLVRAYHTAQIIGERVGLTTIHTDERLMERCFGEISGKEVGLLAHHRATNTPIKDMEQDEAIQKRMMHALDEIVESNAGKRILLVAHSHAIKGALSAIDSEQVQFHSPLANACASYVSFDHTTEKWNIDRYNIHEHIRSTLTNEKG